jgi:hypothetical protein
MSDKEVVSGFSKCSGDWRFRRLLSHFPQLKIYRAWVSDKGGNTSASIAREVVNNLELWSEKFGAEYTAPL